MMRELMEIIGDKIRAAGAPVLAHEYETGQVTLQEVCERLPGLADKILALAESLTLTGAYSIWRGPRARAGVGGVR